jgi:hypothetical protein
VIAMAGSKFADIGLIVGRNCFFLHIYRILRAAYHPQ